MKTQFIPIAMRCTKEQFKAIEPKLIKHGLKINQINFDRMAYIVNDMNYSKIIDYFTTKGSTHYEYYETWDEATFLKACGIEVDTYTVSKDFILEAHKDACPTWKTKIENQFPELFPKKPIELSLDEIAEKFNVDVSLIKIKK